MTGYDFIGSTAKKEGSSYIYTIDAYFPHTDEYHLYHAMHHCTVKAEKITFLSAPSEIKKYD